MLPPLVTYESEDEYKEHYERTYVNSDPIRIADGTEVVFYASSFKHAFYGYSNKWDKKKDKFDLERAKRIDWIGYVLQCPLAESLVDSVSDMSHVRRITLLSSHNYMVVTQPEGNGRGIFITAFQCTPQKAAQVRNYPKWKTQKNRC